MSLLLIGALCALAGVIVGHFAGYLMGVKVRNVSALAAGSSEPDTRVCLCGHSHVAHRLVGKPPRPDGRCMCAPSSNPFGECACSMYIPKPNPVRVTKGELEL